MDELRGKGSSAFGITGDWSTAALDPGVLHSTASTLRAL